MNDTVKYIYMNVKGKGKSLDDVENDCIVAANNVMNFFGNLGAAMDGYGINIGTTTISKAVPKSHLRFIMKYRRDI